MCLKQIYKAKIYNYLPHAKKAGNMFHICGPAPADDLSVIQTSFDP